MHVCMHVRTYACVCVHDPKRHTRDQIRPITNNIHVCMYVGMHVYVCMSVQLYLTNKHLRHTSCVNSLTLSFTHTQIRKYTFSCTYKHAHQRTSKHRVWGACWYGFESLPSRGIHFHAHISMPINVPASTSDTHPGIEKHVHHSPSPSYSYSQPNCSCLRLYFSSQCIYARYKAPREFALYTRDLAPDIRHSDFDMIARGSFLGLGNPGAGVSCYDLCLSGLCE